MKDKLCPNCGKSFTPIRNGWGGTKSCSKECRWELRRRPCKKCLYCGLEFRPKTNQQKYCSISCANHLSARLPKQKICLNCKAEFSNRKNKYCCHKCCAIYLKNCRLQNLLDRQCVSSNKQARMVLLATKGHICSICRFTEWLGKPIGLIVDHIDGNSDNNNLNNLRLVCGNCDMQLPTYKGKNIGKGRVWRKKRYQEGKSY